MHTKNFRIQTTINIKQHLNYNFCVLKLFSIILGVSQQIAKGFHKRHTRTCTPMRVRLRQIHDSHTPQNWYTNRKRKTCDDNSE